MKVKRQIRPNFKEFSQFFSGILMFSTIFLNLIWGGGVNFIITRAVKRFISMPKVPIPSGDIPNHQSF